jgi:hypothetical protein
LGGINIELDFKDVSMITSCLTAENNN